ncbi:MAG: hypothetical protein RQ885_00295 [Desulfurococcales archaeon]|nr:hypothetical protein [Desulfurococcales archaeon]
MNPRSIKQRDLIVDKEVFIDMGLNDLFAVVITDGSAMLVSLLRAEQSNPSTTGGKEKLLHTRL